MPLIPSTYRPKGIFKLSDVSTIYASTLRNVALPGQIRERIDLPDGDFLDLEWNHASDSSKKLVVLLHGLGGDANRPYMKGMARIFLENGWNTAAMNLRGCGAEMNRLYRSYHAGVSEDLDWVLTHIKAKNRYKNICLIGFSLGGNLILKYLGEKREIPKEVCGAVGISVPCDLAGSLGEINRTRNFIYAKRFLIKLKSELQKRASSFPEKLSHKEVEACQTLREIDELYTSKAHGFVSAEDYYQKNSSKQFLHDIEVPCLLISARDDSFLCPSSYPIKQAEASKTLHLQIPNHGGHVGFVLPGPEYYHEKEALNFLNSCI